MTIANEVRNQLVRQEDVEGGPMPTTISCTERFQRCFRDEYLFGATLTIALRPGTPPDTLSLAHAVFGRQMRPTVVELAWHR